MNHSWVRVLSREASLGFFNDKVRPWSKRKRFRRRTCRVEQFLSVLAFDRPSDKSLLIQQLFLTKHRFLLLSFVDRFLPDILYIEIRRGHHCCQKSMALASGWSEARTSCSFSLICRTDSFRLLFHLRWIYKRHHNFRKRICSNLVIASYIWKLARWPALIARVASYLFIFLDFLS